MLTRILENWPYKVAALIIAIALRIYVGHLNDPHTVKQIDIPLTLTGQPSNLVVSDATKDVTLQVSGPASSLYSVTGASYIVTANVAGTRAGINQPLPIRVAAAPGTPSDVSIESQSPKAASVTMEAKTHERFTVHVDFTKVAPTGLSYGSPTVVPPVAMVQGPDSQIARVATLVVYGDDAVSGEISAPGVLDGFGPIIALDAQRAPITGVDIVPAQAEVRVPVKRESAEKALIVNGDIAGTPSYPNEVRDVTVSPDRVLVMGTPDLLAETSVVSTAPIDVTGAAADIRKTVGLVLPPGLMTAAPIEVTVDVHIGAADSAAVRPAPTTAVGAAGTGAASPRK